MELTTREAAAKLGVTQARVRALIAARTLVARRVGNLWLVDADSVDRQAGLTSQGAQGRAMAARVAWAASDLCDGGDAVWLRTDERSRLRARLASVTNLDVVRKWLTSRASGSKRYRVSAEDMTQLLSQDGVVGTGVTAVDAYGLGLSTGGAGEAYVTADLAERLVEDYFLIESRAGNLRLRIVEGDLHLRTARTIDTHRVSTRLIVGVDLADETDSRTQSAGRRLLQDALAEMRDR